jgi:hypothetical protein
MIKNIMLIINVYVYKVYLNYLLKIIFTYNILN